MIAAFTAVLLELAMLFALAYGALRFATKFLRMMRDIEEIKVSMRELKREK